jgi:hypothetical protein
MAFPASLQLFYFIAVTSVLSWTHVLSSEDINVGNSNLRRLDEPQRSRGLERCLQDKIFSERVEIGTRCVCKDRTGDDTSDDEQGIVLVCSDECTFCNDERTVCGLKSEEALYDVESGLKIGMGQVFEYLKFGPTIDFMSKDQQKKQDGDGIVLGIEELDCKEQEVEDSYVMGRCSKCNVYFDGAKCNFCEVTECGKSGSGIFAPIMDCTNIQENAIFDFCSDIKMEEYSLFQAFHPEQFHKCLPMENLLDQ